MIKKLFELFLDKALSEIGGWMQSDEVVQALNNAHQKMVDQHPEISESEMFGPDPTLKGIQTEPIETRLSENQEKLSIPTEDELTELFFEGWQKQKDKLDTRERAKFFRLSSEEVKPLLKELTRYFFRELAKIPSLRDVHLVKTTQELSHSMSNKASNRSSASPSYDPSMQSGVSGNRMPQTEPFLFGRSTNIEELNNAWVSSDINIVTITSPPGIGKSALVNHWLYRDQDKRPNGFNRSDAYTWSFYTQGTTERVISAELFIESALNDFGDPDPSSGTPADKGRRLATYIRENNKLLILDGLEPLQNPPGYDGGRLKDNGLATMLRDLAVDHCNLCVITSWLPVADLQMYKGRTLEHINLEELDPDDGADLLKELGVQGEREELKTASDEVDGHSLTLLLLGGLLKAAYDGRIDRREEVESLQEEIQHGGHANRVMEAFAQWLRSRANSDWLSQAQLSLLKVLSLFDRPVKLETVEAVTRKPLIDDLTEGLQGLPTEKWRLVLNSLRQRRFLLPEDPERPNVVSVHTLTREHFRTKLRDKYEDAWIEGNDRLFIYFQDQAADTPNSVEGMEPLFRAVVCGCNAGRYEEALHEVYIKRIMRGKEFFAAIKLSSYMTLLSVLSYFFKDDSWEEPTDSLNITDQLFLMTEAGRYLTTVKGYAARAVQKCYSAALPLAERHGDVYQQLQVMLGLCRVNRVRAKLDESAVLATRILELCKSNEDSGLLPIGHRVVATNHFYTGDFQQSKQHIDKGRSSANDPHRNAVLAINDPVASCIGYSALTNWFLGFPVQAIEESKEAYDRAETIDHPHTKAVTLLIKCMVNYFINDVATTKANAKQLVDLCGKQGFQLWKLSGEVHLYWAQVHTNMNDDNIDSIDAAISSWKGLNAELFLPYWLEIKSSAHIASNGANEALDAVDQGLDYASDNGEYWWYSELLRMKGNILFNLGNKNTPHNHFMSSIDVARNQNAKSLELRSLVTLINFFRYVGSGERASKYVNELESLIDNWSGGTDTRFHKKSRSILSA